MMNIDPYKAIIDFVIRNMKFDKYAEIVNNLLKVDVSTDKEYQKSFNGFFRVRRNENWQKEYYALFERVKHSNISFAEVITELYKKTGRVEASFSSKMLATINPELPIWDQFVLKNLGLKLEGFTSEEKLQNAIVLYEEIRKKYALYLKTENARACISYFDKTFPDYCWMTDIKKVDFFFWNMREEE